MKNKIKKNIFSKIHEIYSQMKDKFKEKFTDILFYYKDFQMHCC